MITPDAVRHTISVYNEMLLYYRLNKGNKSKYSNTKITDRLINNLEDRRNYLTKKYTQQWGR